MGKVKIKKSDVWIDMTPMSDVMVLLLTFFMLTSTFVKDEAVKVNTPGSVAEVEVPEQNVLSILVNKEGKVFIGMDKPLYMENLLKDMGVKVSPDGVEAFKSLATFGAPKKDIANLLALEPSKINEAQSKMGIPTDSVAVKENGETVMKSEFQQWVQTAARLKDAKNKDKKIDLTITIKADKDTPYGIIRKVMSELQDIHENRYYLVTTLEKNGGE